MNRTGDIYMNRIALAVKSALGIAMLVPPALTLAAAAPTDSALEEIVVTGIRKSVEESIEAKRDSTELTEVVTAEDIGKMPDKNVADSLARLPGVTTSAAGANEGGFDENDRVSMRGTNPSLTQTLINGHSVAAGDWFVLDQVQTVGRSVSYTLLPSEIVSKVVVQKSSSASLVEGGVAGSVDIITRKPLDFSKAVHARGLGRRGVRGICPRRPTASTARSATSRTTPAISASCCSCSPRPGTCAATASRSWAMTPSPHRQRQSRSSRIRTSPACNIRRKSARHSSRRSASATAAWLDIEFKPTDDLTLDLSGFFVEAERQQLQPQLPDVVDALRQLRRRARGRIPGYVVQNNTLTKANFHRRAGHLLWRLRPDLASGRNRHGELRQFRHDLECKQCADLLRPGRLLLGRRQDAAARTCRRPIRASAAAQATS